MGEIIARLTTAEAEKSHAPQKGVAAAVDYCA
jgi:hypothetical protein